MRSFLIIFFCLILRYVGAQDFKWNYKYSKISNLTYDEVVKPRSSFHPRPIDFFIDSIKQKKHRIVSSINLDYLRLFFNNSIPYYKHISSNGIGFGFNLKLPFTNNGGCYFEFNYSIGLLRNYYNVPNINRQFDYNFFDPKPGEKSNFEDLAFQFKKTNLDYVYNSITANLGRGITKKFCFSSGLTLNYYNLLMKSSNLDEYNIYIERHIISGGNSIDKSYYQKNSIQTINKYIEYGVNLNLGMYINSEFRIDLFYLHPLSNYFNNGFRNPPGWRFYYVDNGDWDVTITIDNRLIKQNYLKFRLVYAL